jgi:hypothetical protein
VLVVVEVTAVVVVEVATGEASPPSSPHAAPRSATTATVTMITGRRRQVALGLLVFVVTISVPPSMRGGRALRARCSHSLVGDGLPTR